MKNDLKKKTNEKVWWLPSNPAIISRHGIARECEQCVQIIELIKHENHTAAIIYGTPVLFAMYPCIHVAKTEKK